MFSAKETWQVGFHVENTRNSSKLQGIFLFEKEFSFGLGYFYGRLFKIVLIDFAWVRIWVLKVVLNLVFCVHSSTQRSKFVLLLFMQVWLSNRLTFPLILSLTKLLVILESRWICRIVRTLADCLIPWFWVWVLVEAKRRILTCLALLRNHLLVFVLFL